MILFTKTICPICSSTLKHIIHSSYQEYTCTNKCYSYWTEGFLHIQSFLFRTKDFSVRYVEDSKANTKVMYLYKNGSMNLWGAALYITTVPAIKFSWNALDELNE